MAWRALLSALAGGGITAAGLGGPVGGALGAEATTSTTEAPGQATQTTEVPLPGTTTKSTPPPSTTPTVVETPPPPATTPTTTTPAPAAKAPPAPNTTTTFAAPPPPAPKKHEAQPPTVTLKKKKPAAKNSPAGAKNGSQTKASGANNVALPPALVAGQAQAIAAALASTSASVQALGFYRIPLFLLPIYKAAAVQYGVPWQILAAINEIETDYGADQSVSTAGAVGWMQFMPETWLQYGVDALNAGYADPYNPVDAIFAAARYLRAAGAGTDLKAAIFSYNHSEEYVDSVLLRARLISSYPKDVIATLTGLTDGRVPVGGAQVAWPHLLAEPASAASATAGATPLPSAAGAGQASAGTPTPAVAAARAARAVHPDAYAEVTSAPGAPVVAVEDGRVAQIGHSRALGSFIVLRDVYGDQFTYAGLGSIASTYPRPKPLQSRVVSPAIEAAARRDPAPSHAASSGRQTPSTLSVKPPATSVSAPSPTSAAPGSGAAGKVRLFAHPGNPDAVAAAARARHEQRAQASTSLPLRKGSVVSSGTVLGRVDTPTGAQSGHLRFAIRPAGDSANIDPRPVLTNWAQLQTALHPQGAKAQDPLLGATASDVLLMSRAELERAVLSDPAIALDACARREAAAGRLDRRVLAVLAFLSRSGLQPHAQAVGCAALPAGVRLASAQAAQIDITAINGTPIARHQGAGTITDLTIRTLLTLPAQFVPQSISSLMRYPGAAGTHAAPAFWDRIRVAFQLAAPARAISPASAGALAARSARAALSAPASGPTFVSAGQWEALMNRVGAIPVPNVLAKPSAAAVPDPKHH